MANGWGGARPGAWRKPKGDVAGVPHLRRPRVKRGDLVRVTLRVADDIPSLWARGRALAPQVRIAIRKANDDHFYTRKFQIEADRVTLWVESTSTRDLSASIKGLCVSIAHRVNARLGRKGSVFADRYEMEFER